MAEVLAHVAHGDRILLHRTQNHLLHQPLHRYGRCNQAMAAATRSCSGAPVHVRIQGGNLIKHRLVQQLRSLTFTGLRCTNRWFPQGEPLLRNLCANFLDTKQARINKHNHHTSFYLVGFEV